MFTQIFEPFRALTIDVFDKYKFLNIIKKQSVICHSLILSNSIYFTVATCKNIYRSADPLKKR